MLRIESSTYNDFFNITGDFLSLDISVRSTGWVKKINNNISYGTYTLKSEDELGRRKEFRSFLLNIIGENSLDYVFVEDVIAGTNFKTTKGLIQLNTIVDDLNEYGLISVNEIKRIDNKEWKKYLKKASNYVSSIKLEKDKQLIVNCLNLLGFNENVKQDIYDAIGIAVSIIYRDKVLCEKKKLGVVLKSDIRKGYKTLQYFEEDTVKIERELVKLQRKYNREVVELDWINVSKDIIALFKEKIKKDGVDDKIYVIKINVYKLGSLALTKKLSVDRENCILLVTKNK